MRFCSWSTTLYVGALALAAGMACADEPDRLLSEPLAETFGAQPLVRGLRLSPDGNGISFLQARPEGGDFVRVFDTRSENVVTVWVSDGDAYEIKWCEWANEERLLCGLRVGERLDSGMVFWQRLVAVNADGSKPLRLLGRELATPNVRFEDHVIDWLRDDTQHVLLGMRLDPATVINSKAILDGPYAFRLWSGARVVRLNIYDNVRQIEPDQDAALASLADGYGTVRLRVTLNDPRPLWSGYPYRYWWVRNENEWSPLQEANLRRRADGFSPVSFDRDANEVLYFDRLDDHTALFALNPLDDAAGRLIFSHPDADLAGVYRLGKHDRVAAATYVDNRPRLHFFDPKATAIRDMLSAELPGMSIDVIDEDWSQGHYLAFAYSDRDPGTYYFFDSTNRVLKSFGRAYRALGERGLAATKPVSYTAADGATIKGYLTLPSGAPARAGVVLLNGAAVGRDYWEFDFIAQYLAAKGYAVLQSSYRGFIATFGGWRQVRSDLAAGAKYLADSGVVAEGRVCIVGWTDGAYGALLSAIDNPTQYRCVVGIAAITRPVASAPYMTDVDDDAADTGALVERAAEIDVPTLFFHGRDDPRVPSKEIEQLVERMRAGYKDVTLIEYARAADDIGPTRYRLDMLTRLGAFLGAHLRYETGHFYSRALSDAEPVDVVDFGTDALDDENALCSDRRFRYADGRLLTEPVSGRPRTTGQDASDCRRLFFRGDLVLPEGIAANRSGSAMEVDRVTFFVDPSEQSETAIVRFDDNAMGPDGIGVVYARPGYHTVSLRRSGADYRCTVDLKPDENTADPAQVRYRTVAVGNDIGNSHSAAQIAAYARHFYRIQTVRAAGVLALRVTDATEDHIVLDQSALFSLGCAEG